MSASGPLQTRNLEIERSLSGQETETAHLRIRQPMISMFTHLQVMQPDLTFGLLALGFFKLGESFPDISLLVPVSIVTDIRRDMSISMWWGTQRLESWLKRVTKMTYENLRNRKNTERKSKYN